MELGEMVIIILQITSVIPKKRFKLREGSIENVLVYKDCNHKPKAPILRSNPPPPQQECKMCCTMCCGDQCVKSEQPITQNGGVRDLQKSEPQVIPQPPQPSRKMIRKSLPTPKGDFNTREYIKNLISHDGDVRTILKDLVRVTIQKVDLMKKMETRARETLEESKDEEPDL